jgi:hypothetical protein
MMGDVEALFEDFEEQAWNDESRLILLVDFLEAENTKHPGVFDRLHDFLQAQADEENGDGDDDEEDDD